MELIILHSNDTHGHLGPIPAPDGNALGGYARRATYIQRQRAAHPHLLLLDAGDYYQGSRFWHAFKGRPDIDLMNRLGYDAAALGNHDTDGGVALLAERLKQARFPVLCANMRFPAGHVLANAWQPYTIKSVGGFKIAIFSMLIDAMALYLPEFRATVQVTPAIETARRLVPQLRQQADMVIHLSHLGHLGDIAVAEAVEGIDLIIGGHTHMPLENVCRVNGTSLVRSMAGTQTMGRVEIALPAGQRPQLKDYRLVPMDTSLPDDPAIATELTRWRAKLPPERVLGQLLAPLDTRSQVKGSGESTAGNFFTDALQAYFGAEAALAFVHMGTLRGDRIYGPGDFTNHDLGEYHPFDNRPVLMEITAPQLKTILERGVSALPYPVGTFLSHAGLIVTVDIRRQPQIIDTDHPRILTPGERIVQATHQGQPIDFTDASRTFKVAMDGYMGRGGGGYFAARAGRNIRQATVGTSEIIKWYLATYSPVHPKIEGRIVLLNATK